MTTEVDRGQVVAALVGEWGALDEVLAGLSAEQWVAPSPCPGWRVRDVVAHVIGTERMLLGDTPDVTVEEVGDPPHLHNDIGRFNETWVASLADLSTEELLAAYRDATAARTEVLRDLDDEAWNAVGFTPAGEDTHGRFMRIRVYDSWLHEQDVRDGAGLPGRDVGVGVGVALDEMETALGFIVGKRAGLADGSTVTFELTGEDGRTRHVRVDGGRAGVVDEVSDPTVRLTMSVGTFARLAGGRRSAQELADDVAVTGDTDVGARVLAAMNFTI